VSANQEFGFEPRNKGATQSVRWSPLFESRRSKKKRPYFRIVVHRIPGPPATSSLSKPRPLQPAHAPDASRHQPGKRLDYWIQQRSEDVRVRLRTIHLKACN